MFKTILASAALLFACPALAQFSGNMKTQGAPNLAASQVVVSTTAVQVAAARSTRPRVTLSIGAANNCAVGPAGVTLATGYRLTAVVGASLTLESSAAVFMVCDVSTTVSVIEPF